MKAVRLRNFSGLLGFAIAIALGGAAEAATLILGASNQSRYDSSGVNWLSQTTTNQAPIGNTLTGWRDGVESRSYFVFDIGAVSAPVAGARIRLLNKRYYSTLGSERLQLFDVSTPAADLVNSNNRPDVFNDLGSGALLGETTLVANPTANDLSTAVQEYFEVVLTQAAIAGINQAVAQGQKSFAIGVRLAGNSQGSPYMFTCLDGNGNPIRGCTLTGLMVEGVEFSGGFRDPLRNSEVPGQLILDLEPKPPIGVPEPSAALSLILVGVSAGVLTARSHRHS